MSVTTPSSKASRRTARAAIAVVMFSSLAACSAAADGATPAADGSSVEGFVGYDAMIAEFDAALATLDLPAGAMVDRSLVTGQSADESYQEGYGEMYAVLAWNCLWGREWLEQRGRDEEAAAVALDRYASLLETDTFAEAFDPEGAQPYVRGVVDKAVLGDPSGVQQDVAANCPAG